VKKLKLFCFSRVKKFFAFIAWIIAGLGEEIKKRNTDNTDATLGRFGALAEGWWLWGVFFFVASVNVRVWFSP
jgi:hypothetical protein